MPVVQRRSEANRAGGLRRRLQHSEGQSDDGLARPGVKWLAEELRVDFDSRVGPTHALHDCVQLQPHVLALECT